ncbi:hypothetical protein B0J12DRAFT_698714 [Macrophomina phaseolina]|uniref:C2H2-type domain-containing protein n=1 Tax=Macrophomina phaseolina TaxID=35725 RepID=A0ABQ8GCG1_9PEZI|nr:hypothetical protein B0J12DRAFT_698714 [Macrophomina phaseolina]
MSRAGLQVPGASTYLNEPMANATDEWTEYNLGPKEQQSQLCSEPCEAASFLQEAFAINQTEAFTQRSSCFTSQSNLWSEVTLSQSQQPLHSAHPIEANDFTSADTEYTCGTGARMYYHSNPPLMSISVSALSHEHDSPSAYFEPYVMCPTTHLWLSEIMRSGQYTFSSSPSSSSSYAIGLLAPTASESEHDGIHVVDHVHRAYHAASKVSTVSTAPQEQLYTEFCHKECGRQFSGRVAADVGHNRRRHERFSCPSLESRPPQFRCRSRHCISTFRRDDSRREHERRHHRDENLPPPSRTRP